MIAAPAGAARIDLRKDDQPTEQPHLFFIKVVCKAQKKCRNWLDESKKVSFGLGMDPAKSVLALFLPTK